MGFPEKLIKLIASTRKSQSQLARETGLGQSSISDMTLGRRRPYMDQALLLARALGVPLDYLADDALDEPPAEASSTEERVVLLAYRASRLTAEQTVQAIIDRARLTDPPIEVNPADRIRAVEEPGGPSSSARNRRGQTG